MDKATISEAQNARFLASLTAWREAPSISRSDKRLRLLSQIDVICRRAEGLELLYQHIPQLIDGGILEGTAWDRPERLVPALVSGTLLSGHANSSFELISELRMLALAENRIDDPEYTASMAREFLEDVLAVNFEIATASLSEPYWNQVVELESRKIRNLFDFLLERIPLSRFSRKLTREVEVLSSHRLIATEKIERMLSFLKQKGAEKMEDSIRFYLNALFHPSDKAQECTSLDSYKAFLEEADHSQLTAECRQVSGHMHRSGLVSLHQLYLLHRVKEAHPELVPEVLGLDAHGKAEYERHRALILQIISSALTEANKNALFGLTGLLQRNLLSRDIVRNALYRLIHVDIDPEVAERLRKSNRSDHSASPLQILIGGTLSVLGQPLGIRQGQNPTCQSARGISMWSRHAPGKLINLLIDASSSNGIEFRYEGELIRSQDIQHGLAQKFDFKLDPVSSVLVPLLDKIYNTMMKRAAVKYPGKDPHASVNPAFYGHWIQTGFISVYNPISGAVENYEEFVRTFYASYHPQYNGGFHLIYPVPTGIYITNSSAEMLGYHAVSLLRVAEDPTGTWRAYFFNPNSEGPQNWGQEIRPSVSDKGERPGESSLPVHEFASRIYAFHFNRMRVKGRLEGVNPEVIEKVKNLAGSSWGQQYRWN